MTREEVVKSREYQISNAACKYADSIAQHDYRKTYCIEDFEAGAEWADKHPFLDEVKEMNLNTAVERYIKLHESEFQGYIDLRRIARHFYVLGLNAQNKE